jgi:hypothetical protein
MYVSQLAKKVLTKFEDREDTYDFTIKVNARTGAIWEVEQDTLETSPYQYPFAHWTPNIEGEMGFVARDFANIDVFTLGSTRFFTDQEMQLILLPHISRGHTVIMQMLKIEGINGVREALLVTNDDKHVWVFERAHVKAQEEKEDD